MSVVIILAVVSSVLVGTQLIAGTPTGDPILIGKSRIEAWQLHDEHYRLEICTKIKILIIQ